MSRNTSSAYAVVDITKKRKNRQNQIQQGAEGSGDTQGTYAELGQSSSSVAARVNGVGSHGNNDVSHDVSAFDNPYYDIRSAAGIMGTAEYDSASSPSPATYSQIDGSQISQQPFMAHKRGQSGHDYSVVTSPSVTSKEESKAKHCCPLHPCLLTLFIVLVIMIVAIVVSLVVAFVLIARLNSDLAAMSSSSDSPLVSGLTGLESSFQAFEERANQKFLAMQEQVNMRLKQVEDQARNLSYIQDRLNALDGEVSNKIDKLHSNYSRMLEEQTEKFTSITDRLSSSIANVSITARDSVSSLETKLVSDIQALFVFNSCSAIVNLSLPFPSGMYWVRSSNGSSIQVYCSTSISMSCNGKTGGWRRVAYLNTSEGGPVQCPGELEENINPRSCRIRNSGPGCTSVNFPIGNISYSCVYGRVNGLQSGTLDGFFTPGHTPTLEGNYVDGVSLTYGSPKQHVWSFAAAGSTPPSCMACDINLPEFISENFSCESTGSCPQASECADQLLWSGGPQQCIGNSTFYRELSEPTSEDIEMRVCRDENRNNEDILITFVEIFVL